MSGIEPKETLERKTLTCHRQNEAEASEKYNKYKGDINERNRGRDSNPQRLYDTLISGNHLPNSETSLFIP